MSLMLVVTDQSKFMAKNQRHHPLKCKESIDPSGQENFYHPSHLPTALVGTVEICAVLMHGVQHMRCDWKLIACSFWEMCSTGMLSSMCLLQGAFLVGDMDETKSALMKTHFRTLPSVFCVWNVQKGVSNSIELATRQGQGWCFQEDSHGLGLNVGFSHLFASFFSAQVPEVLPSLGRLAIFSILEPFSKDGEVIIQKKGSFSWGRRVKDGAYYNMVFCWGGYPHPIFPHLVVEIFRWIINPFYQTIKHEAVCLSLHLHHTAGPQASRCLSSECLVKVKCHSMLLAQDQDRWFWEI